MGNPNHDPATGRFASGPGGGSLADGLAAEHANRIAKKTVDRLYSEYRSWTDSTITDWLNVEAFLKEKYPAAARGLDSGSIHSFGRAAYVMLDDPAQYSKDHSWDWPNIKTGIVEKKTVPKLAPYETGDSAVAKYGYDPREIVAGMLMLHNRYNGRGKFEPLDTARLVDIAIKRSKMQRDYEARMKKA